MTKSVYAREYERSLRDPHAFWGEAALAIDWERAPPTISECMKNGQVRWFAGGKLNTCFNAVDRHVLAGRGARNALIYDSAMTGERRRFTFSELRDEVARVAGMIRAQGVKAGDRVIIYMPMIPEAVFAMLACARLGAIHSVVFGGFAPPELAKRIDDAKPALVLSASCGLEPGKVIAYQPLLDEALQRASHRVPRCLIVQRPQLQSRLVPDRDLDWYCELSRAAPADCVAVDATDPLYVLYTSGTTGVPKGIVRDNGGHAVALRWSMEKVFGLKTGETFWAASDIGWVVGHSYIVYAPLLHGCATVLYEGKPVGTPDGGAFWRVIAEHDVSVLFTAPTSFRAIRREDPEGVLIDRQRIAGLRTLFLAGERADPATLQWAEDKLRVPAIDNWWQTELGWPAVATCIGLGESATRHGSAGRPVPGYQVEILDPHGAKLPHEGVGDIALRLPLPPGCLPTLWDNEAGMHSAYLETHPGYYTTGDAGFRDADGYMHVMSRTDDIINVAGHRLSSGGIEQIVAAHPDVAECAVIGAADAIKGCVPVGLIVLKKGVTQQRDAVLREVVAAVRDSIGAVASFRSAAIVTQLPKTRSGKILRGAIRRLADGETCGIPPTIDDPQSLDLVREALASIGYPRGGADAS